MEGARPQTASYLVGMVEGHIPYEDYAISAQTKRPRVVFEENSGLGEIIPMDEIDNLAKAVMAQQGAHPHEIP